MRRVLLRDLGEMAATSGVHSLREVRTNTFCDTIVIRPQSRVAVRDKVENLFQSGIEISVPYFPFGAGLIATIVLDFIAGITDSLPKSGVCFNLGIVRSGVRHV